MRYTPYSGDPMKILSDNETEIKNQLFMDVGTQLGVKERVYFPLYHPQTNGRIEGFHNFIKASMAKHLSKSLEWDQVNTISLHCI